MEAFVTDIWDWWTRVMRAILPARRRTSARAPAIALLRRDRVEIVWRAGDQTIDIPLDELEAGLGEARRGRRAIRGPVTLKLDTDRYVTRSLSSFAVPLSRRRAMAELDLAASTPFQPDEVYAVLSDPLTAAPQPADYHIVRRKVIEPVIAALRHARLPVRDIVLEDGRGGVVALRPEYRAAMLGRTRMRTTRRLLACSLAGLFVLAVAGTFAHAMWRYEWAIGEVTARSQPLEARARKVRELLNEREDRLSVLAALRTRIAESRTATETWEELTRVLPDSAWLTDMTLTPDAVRIAGFAEAAPAIVAPLEGSPLFQNAEFTGPVVRVPGQQGQRFTLQMEFVQQ